MCGGGGGGRETETPRAAGSTHDNGLKAHAESAGGGEAHRDAALSPVTDNSPPGSCRTLAAQPCRRNCSALKAHPVPPSSSSGCFFHVPPVAAHFEPVSNGGPRTDLPAEECVLLLIRQTARSFCPPAPEVRTDRRRGGRPGVGRERAGPAGRLSGCPVWVRGLGNSSACVCAYSTPAGLLWK